MHDQIFLEHWSTASPFLVTVVKDYHRCNTTLRTSVHKEKTSVATARILLSPSQGNQTNTALFSVKLTGYIDAPYPVEMKDWENEGSSTSFVYVCIDNI